MESGEATASVPEDGVPSHATGSELAQRRHCRAFHRRSPDVEAEEAKSMLPPSSRLHGSHQIGDDSDSVWSSAADALDQWAGLLEASRGV